MRKRNFILNCLSILCGMIIIASCNDEQLADLQVVETEKEVISEKGKMLSLTNKTELLNLIRGVDLKSPNTRVVEQRFISMMDGVRDADPILNKFSIEERKYIKDNELTYYDVLGFDDLVPNEDFAHLLNSRGDIQVSDTIYRITPYGTLYTAAKHAAELEIVYNNLVNTSIEFKHNDYELKLSNHVALINTFDRVSIDNNYTPSGGSTTAASGGSGENIPYQNFKRYSNESHTFAGKLLGKVLGDRSVKHHDFMSGHRVKGSLYDYNYGVYAEVGAYVAMRKKRGGFLKSINGWKGIRADRLSIIYKGIVLEMDTKVPANLKIPKTPVILNNNVKLDLAGVGKQLFCLDICGLSITDKEVMKLAGMGLKSGLAELKKWVNKDIKSNIQAVRILTKSTVYIIIFDNQIDKYNVEQVRKVFSSGVRFYISSTMIKDPVSVKAALDFMKGLRDLPVKKMKGGEVILAGKLNNNWGGMIIYKD